MDERLHFVAKLIDGETMTFYPLPRQHHKHLKSTNMLEGQNEEIERRTRVVRIFPNPESSLHNLTDTTTTQHNHDAVAA